MYIVIVGPDRERFENLNQVYGFLCGRIHLYRMYYPTFRMFKRWWGIRRRKGQREPQLTIQGTDITIAKTR